MARTRHGITPHSFSRAGHAAHPAPEGQPGEGQPGEGQPGEGQPEEGHERTDQKVAIITGGSRGIGAGLVAAYRRRGWAVVASSRTIKPAGDRDVLTVSADVSEAAGTDRIIGEAIGRFGRIDTLINNAGVFITKPFTDYTAEDYAAADKGVQLSAITDPDGNRITFIGNFRIKY